MTESPPDALEGRQCMRATKPRITGLLTSALHLHSESSCATSLVAIVLARAEPPRGDGVQRHEHEMDAAGTIHADTTRGETVVLKAAASLIKKKRWCIAPLPIKTIDRELR